MGSVLCWADIPVTDLDRAIAYYSAVLGEAVMKHHDEHFEIGVLPHAETQPSGCLVKSPENRPSEHGPLVYLSVNGRLDDAVEAAKKGGKVLKEKHAIGPYGFRALILDSEGNRIALHSQTA